MITQITPILVADRLEPCIPFWTERLGFEKTAEVPHGDHLGFAMLTNGKVTVMLQSRDSIDDDIPNLLTPNVPATAVLFITVDNLADIIARMDGADIVMPERKTFYKMHEIGVREPGGNIVIFAQPVEE